MSKRLRFQIDKLIRDKLPEILYKQEVFLSERIMEKEEYIIRLKEKLLEEAKEVESANTHEELIEELADVMEVINAMLTVYAISYEEVEQKRLNKKEEKGGFDKKVYSSYVEIEEHNEKAEYYRSKSQGYPEIHIT